MAMRPLDPYRYKEFQKEEKRRAVGKGNADNRNGNRNESYDGSAAQAYGLTDNSAYKITNRVTAPRATSPHSALPMKGRAP